VRPLKKTGKDSIKRIYRWKNIASKTGGKNVICNKKNIEGEIKSKSNII
jgi:hypothetical protein